MYSYKGTVVRVVDGDTIIANVDLGFHVWLVEIIRLAQIDAPERGTDGGTRATVRMQELLPPGQLVRLDVASFDRYKRAVALIFTLDAKGIPARQSISAIMLAEGLAGPYPK